MWRLMQIKYPVHLNAITVSRIENLFHEHGRIVVDYQEELNQWNDLAYYEQYVKKIKLPHNIAAITPVNAVDGKKRCMESPVRNKHLKKSDEKIKLELLCGILSLYENAEMAKFEKQLHKHNIANLQDLKVRLF